MTNTLGMIYKQLPKRNLVCTWWATVQNQKAIQLALTAQHNVSACSSHTYSLYITSLCFFHLQHAYLLQPIRLLPSQRPTAASSHPFCFITLPPACHTHPKVHSILWPNERTHVILCKIDFLLSCRSQTHEPRGEYASHDFISLLWSRSDPAEPNLVFIGHIFHCRLLLWDGHVHLTTCFPWHGGEPLM